MFINSPHVGYPSHLALLVGGDYCLSDSYTSGSRGFPKVGVPHVLRFALLSRPPARISPGPNAVHI